MSDRHGLPGGDVAAWARALRAAGVEALWLREKDLRDLALLQLARAVRVALPRPAVLLLSARPDLAIAAEADGVHLPAAGLPIAPVRRRWGGRLLIGRSTHSPAEVEHAAKEGADYVTFGPVYPTPSKAAFGPPRGLGELARASRWGIPVLALGGVTGGRLGDLAAAGAAGAAAVRLFQDLEALPSLLEAAGALFPRPAAALSA